MIFITLAVFAITNYYRRLETTIAVEVVLFKTPHLHVFFVDCVESNNEILNASQIDELRMDVYICWEEIKFEKWCQNSGRLMDPVVNWGVDGYEWLKIPTRLSEVLTHDSDRIQIPAFGKFFDELPRNAVFEVRELIFYHCDMRFQMREITQVVEEEIIEATFEENYIHF